MQLKQKGFTLIELLLVMVIISVIIYASISYVQQQAESTRIARTSAQMQQILNAGLAYYIDNGSWPTPNSISTLQPKYLPSSSIVNPWGQPYQIFSYAVTATNPRLFYVYTTIPVANANSASAAAAATAIAGLLPFGYTSKAAGNPPVAQACTKGNCVAVAAVNIPGQNLNNATAVNFAGLYHHGGCVPVPSCPVDAAGVQMVPQIMVVPASVSGVKDPDSTNVYPISSFTAYATSNRGAAFPTDKSPPACDKSTSLLTPICQIDPVNDQGTAAYWRVCLQIVTAAGDVQVPTRSNDRWGQYITLLAITRCAPVTEAAGSAWSIYNSTN